MLTSGGTYPSTINLWSCCLLTCLPTPLLSCSDDLEIWLVCHRTTTEQDKRNICSQTRRTIWSFICRRINRTRCFFSARKILAPGEEENLELEEEEEDAAAGGAGSMDAFPPRAPGTVLLPTPQWIGLFEMCLLAVQQHVITSSYLWEDRLTLCLFVLSVGAVHGFLAHSCPLHLQLRKVQLDQPASSDCVSAARHAACVWNDRNWESKPFIQSTS